MRATHQVGGGRGRCSTEVKRSIASHEGEEYLVRHPPSHPSAARCPMSERSSSYATHESQSYCLGDGVENLGGDRFDFAPVGIDCEIGDLEVQRLAVGGEPIEYRALVTGFEQGPFAAAAGAF